VNRSFLFALSAGLHAWVGWRIVPALPLPAGILMGLLLLASAIVLPLGLFARRSAGRGGASAWIAWGSLIAMGLFSSLFVLTVARDLALLAASAVAWVWPASVSPDVWRPVTAAAVPLLALAITAIGAWNARRTAAVVHVDVPIAGLPEALHGFTIAQISDVHVGPTIGAGYLGRIVEAVNRLEADMVAITGDLVDGSVEALGPHVTPLRDLRSRHGSFFVTGNHEYYSGAHAWIAELRRLDVTVLVNEHVALVHQAATVLVAGVTDPSAHHFDPTHRSDPQAALQGAPADAHVRLLLAHQPRTATAAAQAGYDLQLSGHTHGGQFWPWNLVVRWQQPYSAGLYRLRGLWLYVSRGTGYWGPPKRLGAPSEITRLRLVPADAAPRPS
jgi:predicted MPP superfamily phosphohydrolase